MVLSWLLSGTRTKCLMCWLIIFQDRVALLWKAVIRLKCLSSWEKDRAVVSPTYEKKQNKKQPSSWHGAAFSCYSFAVDSGHVLYIPLPGHLCEMEGEVKVGEHLVPAHLNASERAQFFQTVEERAVDSISTNNLPLFCPSTPGGSC